MTCVRPVVLGLILGGAAVAEALMSPLSVPVGEIPAIDRDVPAKLETATFALG
jgi:hypothetical protein